MLNSVTVNFESEMGDDQKPSKAVGFGLFETLSCVNHSCQPNAMIMEVPVSKNNGNKFSVVLKSLEKIEKGSEILISYIDLSTVLTLTERQTELRSAYGFECKCRRCLRESQNLEKYEKLYENYSEKMSTLLGETVKVEDLKIIKHKLSVSRDLVLLAEELFGKSGPVFYNILMLEAEFKLMSSDNPLKLMNCVQLYRDLSAWSDKLYGKSHPISVVFSSRAKEILTEIELCR
jgi:hypothetical protein